MAKRTPNFGSPEDELDWEALARFLAGESSAEEADAVRAWLEADPSRRVPVGARDSVRLPDGSRVLLGPQSQLTVLGGYGGVGREVELRDEGHADVVHD